MRCKGRSSLTGDPVWETGNKEAKELASALHSQVKQLNQQLQTKEHMLFDFSALIRDSD